MKNREKKYLFEGFLNVLVTAIVSLTSGFFMGVVVGALWGVNYAQLP